MRFFPTVLMAVLMAVLAIGLSACSSTKPTGDDTATAVAEAAAGLKDFRVLAAQQPFTNLPRSGRFDFVGPVEIPDDPSVDEGAGERLRRAVISELGKKGFEFGGSDPAVLVRVRVVLDENVNAFAPMRREGRFVEWIRPAGDDHKLEKGALILDIVDPKTKWAIWRGVCGANVVLDVSEAEREARIEYIMRRLLESFPPESSP